MKDTSLRCIRISVSKGSVLYRLMQEAVFGPFYHRKEVQLFYREIGNAMLKHEARGIWMRAEDLQVSFPELASRFLSEQISLAETLRISPPDKLPPVSWGRRLLRNICRLTDSFPRYAWVRLRENRQDHENSTLSGHAFGPFMSPRSFKLWEDYSRKEMEQGGSGFEPYIQSRPIFSPSSIEVKEFIYNFLKRANRIPVENIQPIHLSGMTFFPHNAKR